MRGFLCGGFCPYEHILAVATPECFTINAFLRTPAYGALQCLVDKCITSTQCMTTVHKATGMAPNTVLCSLAYVEQRLLTQPLGTLEPVQEHLGLETI